ncbi:pyrroline-5-carboxylate reductase [Flexibacter flexilis DSM 6793]|uniref:Pyrroline-5-carboxylate reductase n=1 Tax=Flexibacter flexilis DSM 6793 TaxID=927664 RepID=A0A1I1ITR8_9BACT|nr:pyrroline-5-carboxylate reductase [Flexibacter flexilis]SFC39644.1 pyrroline-5-carboxylate reductase [Flexibacter flexilis DSM 6793]
MKILIIGGGNMGTTYAESLVASHAISRQDLHLLERTEAKAEVFRAKGFVNVHLQAGDYIDEIDVIILAVKPQDAHKVYPMIAPYINDKHLILSVMAGVKIQNIQATLPTERIIRVMPNLPAQIGMGMSGFTADASVSKVELFAIQNLLNTTGKSIYFEQESLIDAVTAVSGSGPAYVYYFMESMINAAQQMGFSLQQAELLVEQTFMGAVHLLNLRDLSCREWITRVASKGGTTEAALSVFEARALDKIIAEGLQKANERAIALGQ